MTDPIRNFSTQSNTTNNNVVFNKPPTPANPNKKDTVGYLFVKAGPTADEVSVKDACEKSKEIVKGLKSHPIMKDIEKFKDNPRMLAYALSTFVSLVEEKIPEIKQDQPGWDGNNLRTFVNREQCPQLYCTDEAKIVIEALNELKKQGMIPNYEIKEVNSSAYGTHTAVGLYESGSKEPTIILDPWMSGPGSAPEVFFQTKDNPSVKKSWEKSFTEYSKAEEKGKKEFASSFKYSGHKDSDTSGDYIALKFFTNKDIRSAATPREFTSFKNRLIQFLDKDGFWDSIENGKDIKQKLASLNIKDKSSEEIEEAWKMLEPYINIYFNKMYPGNKLVNEKFE